MRCTPGVFFIVAQRSSRCPYTLLLIELPTPVLGQTSVMAFSIKYTEGVRPGKKLQMLKRSAEEMYDASAAVLTKGLLNFKPAG